ncbi:MAG: alpha/beta hydrolase family protein [Candidatus Binataceae bacterium]
MKRFHEQRWLLDTVVETIGIEWDQNRIAYTSAAAGPEAIGDFMGVKARVRKFSDIPREFARAAKRREAAARSGESEGRTVSARDSYFAASLLYGSAMWAIFANTPENIEYNDRKIECYKKFIQFAPRKITRVEIPFAGKSLPGYLHIPPQASGRVPCVLAIDGMDGFKEMMVAEYGDKLLERGVAVLAIDGPGQGECCVREIHCETANFIEAGRAALTWLREQPAIDSDRIAISAVSMGSFWSTQIASADEHLRGCAVAYVCHEPGLYTLLNAASPTFKLRFMYMAGYDDEEKFDGFARSMDLGNFAANIKCPYMAIAGEDDELSPIENTYRLMEQMTCPKELIVYQGERHSLHSTTSTALGPSPHTYIADWLADRLAAKPMESRRMFVDLAGQVQVTPW